ncbi:MAG: DUF4301 family protein, partial [Proteobacteria bacterium]|nr:DUF4301 family protein [Pseudomonadota bacterium]
EEDPPEGEERKRRKVRKKMTGILAGYSWSAGDRERIAAEGLSLGEVERQLATFRRGVLPVRLNRACRPGDGIVVLSEVEKAGLLAGCEKACRTRRLMKFVPASGAASRMFRDWHRAIEGGASFGETERTAFVRDLRGYAFFPDLEAALAASGKDLQELIGKRDEAVILSFIMTEEGLDYGRLPKALLKFHAYREGGRTALEEHLVEAALYARDAGNVSRLHFTVSPEHESAVRGLLSRVTGEYERRMETVFSVGLSTQDPATNTLAADPDLHPFRNAEGELVFRPGGHGSLLANLNGLEADIVFLKNIDNCVPDRLKAETVLWKKLLAGYLVALQEEMFASLLRLDDEGVTEREIGEIAEFCERKVNIVTPPGFRERPLAERRAFLAGKLNRPLRVCGMVKNEGEPGGGPFWIDGGDAGPSLQIVEEFQIDRNSEAQRAVWASSTHFNPVDLVCGIRDYRGGKFDLTAFVDPETAYISRKSEKGRDLLALERPGLWNGSMAFWNTVFVEVPLATFNPVKTVTDLLRPQHLSE